MLPTCADYVPIVDYQDLGLENNSLKEQLVQCLEELASRERELTEMQDACMRWGVSEYHVQRSRMAAVVGWRRASLARGSLQRCRMRVTCRCTDCRGLLVQGPV